MQAVVAEGTTLLPAGSHPSPHPTLSSLSYVQAQECFSPNSTAIAASNPSCSPPSLVNPQQAPPEQVQLRSLRGASGAESNRGSSSTKTGPHPHRVPPRRPLLALLPQPPPFWAASSRHTCARTSLGFSLHISSRTLR